MTLPDRAAARRCSLDQPADGVVSAFFRKHKALGARERHTLAETAYAVLRQRLLLQHLAQSGSGAAGAPAGRSWPGRAARPSCAARWARTSRPGWAGARHRPQHAAREAAPQPARLAGDRAAPTAGRRVLAAGAGAGPGRAAGPARQHLKAKREDVQRGAGRGRHRRPCRRRIRPGACASGQAGAEQAGRLHGGAVEVQDEGSQLLALLTDAKRGEMVVDFCAGAGGKTLALGAMRCATPGACMPSTSRATGWRR
jgi:16S rRNA (cytosine967-C5)-methyltransferase